MLLKTIVYPKQSSKLANGIDERKFMMKGYSKIPLLRPPKIKTSCPLKTLFVKLKLLFSSFSTHSVALIRDHL